MQILLHSCCAPCSIEVVNALSPEFELTAFFYNPNIHPYKEFKRRLETLQAFAGSRNVPLAVDGDYALEEFLKGAFTAQNRCAFCYRLRLTRAADYARDQGFKAFTTSLLISPYQKHELVKAAGEAAAAQAGITFVYRDFRPHFRKSWATAKELGLYCQNYCGCIFSEKERFYKS